MTESARLAAVAHPVLDGHRRVDALWFPHDWLDETARRRRLVAAWRAGSRAHRFADGDLLCFAQGLEADCEALAGWPLQRVAGTLCSAAIEAADLAGRPFADAWLAVGGALRPLRLADAAVLDPSLWLAADAAFVETFELRLHEAAATLVAPSPRELREVLGPDVPQAASAESLQLLQALKQRATADVPTPAQRAARTLPAPGAAPSFAFTPRRLATGAAIVLAAVLWSSGTDAGLREFMTTLASVVVLALLLAFVIRRSKDAGGAGGRQVAAHGAGATPARQRPGDAAAGPARTGGRAADLRARFEKRLPERWRDWLARAAMGSGLARLLGAQHAAYLRRMLAMFDDGRIEDALRHAIPLGGADGETLGQAFGRLGPRRDLALRAHRGASPSISFGNDFESHLRALYRRTFEKLAAAGRIDEATFVLAELLGARQEALDYLEKHGRFRQAAELAFGWDMPAAQIVRLHALAGDWRQAVRVAHRDDAFAAAITLLETRWPEAGARLHREWADALVAQGRWLEAVQAAWPLADQRSRAGEWLQLVEDAGGTLAARALALRAQCLPESLASRGASLEALRDDPALAAERAALAHELLRAQAPIESAARRLAAFVLGATIADQAGAQPTLDATTLQALAAFTGDAALGADLPDAGRHWPGIAAQALVRHCGQPEWPAPPAGLQAILDAVPLADGEFLVALGEAGALRLDARGRRLAHFDAPAHRLVIATDGRSALVLAARESVWRVTRLEIARGTTADLGLHEFSAFADTFDGIGWTVATGRRVQVLDTTAGLREALWQVADLPGNVVFISATRDTELLFLLDSHDGQPQMQVWNYELPRRRLRSREPAPLAGDAAGVGIKRIVVQDFGLVDIVADPKRPEVLGVRPSATPDKPCADLPNPGPVFSVHAADGLIALRGHAQAMSAERASAADEPIRLRDFATGQLRATWHWPGDAETKIRVVGATWLVFDAAGRLSAVDAATGLQRGLSVQ